MESIAQTTPRQAVNSCREMIPQIGESLINSAAKCEVLKTVVHDWKMHAKHKCHEKSTTAFTLVQVIAINFRDSPLNRAGNRLQRQRNTSNRSDISHHINKRTIICASI